MCAKIHCQSISQALIQASLLLSSDSACNFFFFFCGVLCKMVIFDMQTHLKRVLSASLNLFPRSFSPLAVTQSWLRKRFAKEARRKNQPVIITVTLDGRKVDLNEVTYWTDRSALCRQQGSLLSLTQWTEAGRDTGLC